MSPSPCRPPFPCAWHHTPAAPAPQEIEERVTTWLNSGCDPEAYWNLCKLNGPDGEKYAPFWDACAKYLELEVGTGAEERRRASDGGIAYAASVISVPISDSRRLGDAALAGGL